jgi:DNA-binding transcriptional MerR regulator
VSSTGIRDTYTIKEAAALTGMPASTLRYYQSIGVIAPIRRGSSSGHRVYTTEDLDLLTWISRLSSTGMSVHDIRRYVANGSLGADAAPEQIELLRVQEEQLVIEARSIALRRRYVGLKIDYWRAVQAGDESKAAQLSDEANSLVDDITKTKKR